MHISAMSSQNRVVLIPWALHSFAHVKPSQDRSLLYRTQSWMDQPKNPQCCLWNAAVQRWLYSTLSDRFSTVAVLYSTVLYCTVLYCAVL